MMNSALYMGSPIDFSEHGTAGILSLYTPCTQKCAPIFCLGYGRSLKAASWCYSLSSAAE
jgi:hypothetical protein